VHSSFYPKKAIHEADSLMSSYSFLLPAISIVLTSHIKLPTHHLQENFLGNIEHHDITHTEAVLCVEFSPAVHMNYNITQSPLCSLDQLTTERMLSMLRIKTEYACELCVAL